MKRDLPANLPLVLQRSLQQVGANIRIARLKRNMTALAMADAMHVHRTTYSRVEAGDPMVAFGIYACALKVLGLDASLLLLADPRSDEYGLQLDLQRLARRASACSAARRRPPAPARLWRRPPRTLKIGVLVVMSGPAAVWGQVNKLCAEITAEMYNEDGGIDIGGEKLPIDIVSFDDRLVPSMSAEGARHLTENEGIRYIIGPNVEQTLAAALPVAERNSAMLFPYSFTRAFYKPPRGNTVLGQIAGYQALPSVYGYLRAEGARTIAMVAPGTQEGLRQRQEASHIAASLGLRVVSEASTYTVGSDHLEDAIAPALVNEPDVLALPNVAPLDACRLIRRARELGFNGPITTESAQDVEHLIKSIGESAEGLIMVGGASLPERRSKRMREFIARFTRNGRSWNDEAGTKAYALEFLLATLQFAGEAALDDISYFKSVIPHFSTKNPLDDSASEMSYFGAREFNHKRQIGIPLVVNTIRGGRLQTLFSKSAEETLS